ncbi:hypothetical protein Poli38472_004793 [Pythium oligandrum]|uniref:BZIP domain-containing protein n=1 Tax=Pythium oligandrum TaxID=41045 RepID=A0A8K1CAG1_PYTOL|nr:hypothetical protein Poli38472_004793 [Pythium oligandrum]|eukprot:TMW59724.1 hypothetical protein Poli38472_004793 [Pythium oligandrum]
MADNTFPALSLATALPMEHEDSTWLEFDDLKAFAPELNLDLDLGIQSESNEDDVDEPQMTKEELRKHKNRQSAARSRQRNRERLEQLEGLVRDLEVKNRDLQETVQMLAYERMAYNGLSLQATVASPAGYPMPQMPATNPSTLMTHLM